MNRMMSAIWMGMIMGSLAVAYLGMVISTPHLPQQVETLEATLVQSMGTSKSMPEGASAGCTLRASFTATVRQWCGWIETHAAEHQMDPNLVAAVMQQESGGNPNAYSASGAVGLLQVMPSDGVAAGFYCDTGPCFAGRPPTRELLDPQFNIAYGTNMLAGLLQRYGNVREALRAYGPMDVGYNYADTVMAIYGGS